MAIYNIIKDVINAGGYKLSEIQYKIKKMYMQNELDEAQADELLKIASGNISVDAERPELLSMIKELSYRVDSLERRLAASETVPDGGGEQNKYPVWKPWDGVSSDYAEGSVVLHKDELWISTYAGQNVWEPGMIGTEALWSRYN